jgi:RNA recognition motif-containing protein
MTTQIPKDMNEELLLPFFSEFGPVAELTVIRDKINQTHKGTKVWDTLNFSDLTANASL